mgnify:CR=1 FL=1
MAEIEINTAGHLKHTRVFETITRSDFRMTYKEVDQILCPHPQPLSQ